nr:MAG TPA: hypothetical protein [Bacteriophage sp.]
MRFLTKHIEAAGFWVCRFSFCIIILIERAVGTVNVNEV